MHHIVALKKPQRNENKTGLAKLNLLRHNNAQHSLVALRTQQKDSWKWMINRQTQVLLHCTNLPLLPNAHNGDAQKLLRLQQEHHGNGRLANSPGILSACNLVTFSPTLSVLWKCTGHSTSPGNYFRWRVNSNRREVRHWAITTPSAGQCSGQIVFVREGFLRSTKRKSKCLCCESWAWTCCAVKGLQSHARVLSPCWSRAGLRVLVLRERILSLSLGKPGTSPSSPSSYRSTLHTQ